MPIVLEWYAEPNSAQRPSKAKVVKIKPTDWHTLDSEDLRFKFSQLDKNASFYLDLKKSKMIFDVNAWLKIAS